MPDQVKALLVCYSVTEMTPSSDMVNFEVKMSAITNGHPEDNNYSKYTPSAMFEMVVTNPAVEGYFRPGKVYDFVITEHEKETKE